MKRGEHELTWLGTARFWGVFGAIFFLGLLLFFYRREAVGRANAVVPVVSITGPERLVSGGTARYAVLVRDRYGAPLPDADIRVGFWRAGITELGRGRSSESGDATIEIKVPDDFHESRALVAIAEAGVAEGRAQLGVTPDSPGQGSTFISTDKPIYQPGQTVHLRALTMAGETPVGDRPSTVEIRTPDGIKVFRAEKPTSAFGVVAHDFPLAEQVKLGIYSISFSTTTADGKSVSGSRTFEVKRYSLPKLKLALEELPDVLAEGAALRGVARAKWIFGEPVTKGAMTVSVDGVGAAGSAIRVKGQLNKDGEFRFELFAPKGYGAFTVRAALEVEGGITAEATHSIARVATNQIPLEVFPESGVLAAEVTQDVYVVVTHPNPSSVVVRGKDIASSEVKVSAQGIAVLRVSPPRGQTLDIEAIGPAGAKGKIALGSTLDRLVVRPDRTEYDAGQAMKLSVLGAEPGDRIALRVTKGTEPLAIGMCTVVGNGCEATLAMPAKISGLVWLHAMSLPGAHREVRAGKRLVVVKGGARDLELKVTPSKAAYAPREQGDVDVAVSGMGTPTKAQLGVSIADEAVFALGEVRPDLEKKFFTTDKDLASARRGGYWYGGYSSVSSPGAGKHEASKVYDAATPEDVRGAVLAALTTMQEPGGFEDASSSSVSQKAEAAVEMRKSELAGSAILFVTFMAMVLFACFAAYGIVRWRRPLLLFADDEDAEAKAPLVRETRALLSDWLASVLAPPIFLFVGLLFGEIVIGSVHQNDAAIAGFWVAIALFAAVALVRAVLRIRRLPLLDDAPVLKRALLLLPFASFLGHIVIMLVVVDRGRRLEQVFPVRQDAALLALAIVTLAQLTFGFLSIIRQGLLRPLAKKTKVWLFLSRASFIGLPLSLAAIFGFAWMHSREQRSSSWTDGDVFDKQTSGLATEGGMGTRAKGEEGSMGNPLAALGGGGRQFAPPAAEAAPADDAKKPAAPGGDAKPVAVVRDYFPETLLWAPEIFTDDAGHAKVTVPFADSITTWRFAVSAVSKTGQLGSAILPLVVKQDFFVEASLPPLLTQGDEIAVPVTVYGYTDEAQDVTLDLEGDGIAAVGPANFSLRLGKNETRGMRFVVRADKAGDRVVRIKASSRTRADVVERKVKIVPNGLELVRPLNGRLQGGATVRADLPSGAIDGGNDLYVKIYGGPLSQVAEGLDGVFTMPHGCFEQTSSVTYPSILALDFLMRSKAASPEVERKARAYIADGYQRLVSFQVEGGGFSLFGRSPASPMLTAYGLMELADMSRVAVVDESLVARTREWLYTKHTQTGGYKKNDSDTADNPLATAYVTWALASFGTEKQPQTEPRLAALLDYVERTNLPGADDAYGLALRANALLAGGRGDRAKLLLDKLASLAIRTEEGVHWSSSESGVLYSYGSSLEVETTGLAAHALARAGRDADLRAGALDWLVARKSSYGTWSTTQSTIAAMRALLDEAKPAPKGPQLVTVTVDGEKVETYDMQPKARDVHHHVDLRRFASTGTHAVELRATGEGDVSYQLVSTHWIPWERPKPASLALEVNYGASAVPVGATTRVHARISWNGKEPAVMPLVEIAIPPAFEAEPADLDALVSTNREVARWTLEHGKVTLYLTSLAQDKPVDAAFTLRALRPAKVVASASDAYLYYRPEVRTETAPVVLTAR